MYARHTIQTAAASIAATVTLLFTGGLLFGVQFVGAQAGSGERPVFVAVDPPQRILDTRAPSGPTAGQPVGAGQTLVLSVVGAAGVPAGTTSVQLNVTVDQGTQPSFLTVWPEGPWPGTSTLNWNDSAAHPNGTTAGIGADGAVRVFNYAGTVHVIVDVTGYYVDHHHDDRYYTKAEVDAAIAAHDAKSMYAAIESDGDVAFSTPGITAGPPFATGSYAVDFPRDIAGCMFVATASSFDVPASYGGRIAVVNDTSIPGRVDVSINLSDDNQMTPGFFNSAFFIQATCP